MDVYKERIVGALVLVALAVIVLPWLLDNDKGNGEFRSRIPPQPEAPQERQLEISDTRPLDELKNEETVIALTPNTTSETPAANPVLPVSFAERGFVIQLGSFSNLDNARKLVGRLQGAGHKAYMREEKREGQVIARVLEGPHLNRSEAEALLPKLRSLSGNTGMVVAFDPVKH
jgi:DedD protein